MPLKIVIIGHVDHGKSTLVGKLLVTTKAIEETKIDSVKKICQQSGKKFEYAFLLDALEEEQRQGVTIDLVRVSFKTKQKEYQLIDAPGHKEFLKNMISGAASADAAILLLDVNEGVREQSMRHAHILSLMGIQNVAVLINKMDLADYSEEKYTDVQKQYEEYLQKIGIEPIAYIPISAFEGENLFEKSRKMPWYTGKNFLETLDDFPETSTLDEKPFRMPIQDVYKFDERRIFAGRVENGNLKIGEKVKFYPSEKTGIIKKFENWQAEEKKQISAGESVGFTLEDQIFVERGEICIRERDNIHVSNTFRANIIWMGNNHLRRNKKYLLKLTTQEVECSLLKIEKRVHSTDLTTDENVQEIARNEIAQVVFYTENPICFDTFLESQEMGRFVLVDDFQVSGGGIIHENQVVDADFVI